MKKHHNHLSHRENYELCEAIKELRNMENPPTPFKNWDSAIRYFESVVQCPFTKPNIETAADICKVPISQLVSQGDSEHLFARMMAKVEKLEARLEKLESLVGGI